MTEIMLKIKDTNNTDYPQIVLRKFFHMVFVSEDGKKLSIYTATVFGGVSDSVDNMRVGEIPKVSYKENTKCSISFKYECGNDCRVSCENLTESFWGQVDSLKSIWGSFEKLSTQEQLKCKLEKIVGSESILKSEDINKNKKTKKNLNIPKIDAKMLPYYICEKGKPNHECVVVQGTFKKGGTSSEYILSDMSEKYASLEFMNWVKTEIVLPVSILEKNVDFKIILEDGDRHIFYTPDFTWYFALPEGYEIDENSAAVYCGDRLEEPHNMIQTVSKDTTIHLKEWVEVEHIDERRKVRLLINQHFKGDSSALSKNKELRTEITITNPRRSENKQFLIGLVAAFLLSYCSDKTRINDYYRLLHTGGSCTLGKCENFCNALVLLFPVLVVSAFVSFIFSLKKCIPKNRKKRHIVLIASKIIGIFATVLLFIYIFGFWMIFTGLAKMVVQTCKKNVIIVSILYLVGFVCNLIYVWYCMFWRKKKIFDYLSPKP